MMSILIIILTILAIFHLFYQSVIVKTNHMLLQDDLEFERLLSEVYLRENKANLAPVELKYVKNIQDDFEHLKYVVTEANLLEYLLFIREEMKANNGKETILETNDRDFVRKEIIEIENRGIRVVLRSIFTNSFLFMLLTSPVIIIVKFIATLLDKKITLDKVEKFSTKHC
ncbi:TPA: hypothetical protein ACSE9U_003686 [Acinetobacter baumannii]|uniref:hypothetical protein n=1 Tax=Acinetobacter TaxID=469 RepID=UPI00112BBD1B|nr:MULTISPECIES: hypothetical protein [Acinetobacter]EKU9952669.1 hypothetical protein [Acinetobacter baumannii]EKX3723627.1 hypothetical protein [Acinetobacter baumannii]EKX3754478.1 hypothetical protein [Acinetobacter baumannii]MDQ8869091.1 hypothetical protein [Acinetobacter baumannii]MDW8490638.1 hypothetical protein [Acinetobacter sp. OYA S30]